MQIFAGVPQGRGFSVYHYDKTLDRLVSGIWHLCGTRLLSNRLEFSNFCGRCVSTQQLLHKVNIACNNCFRKIFNVCYVQMMPGHLSEAIFKDSYL